MTCQYVDASSSSFYRFCACQCYIVLLVAPRAFPSTSLATDSCAFCLLEGPADDESDSVGEDDAANEGDK